MRFIQAFDPSLTPTRRTSGAFVKDKKHFGLCEDHWHDDFDLGYDPISKYYFLEFTSLVGHDDFYANLYLLNYFKNGLKEGSFPEIISYLKAHNRKAHIYALSNQEKAELESIISQLQTHLPIHKNEHLLDHLIKPLESLVENFGACYPYYFALGVFYFFDIKYDLSLKCLAKVQILPAIQGSTFPREYQLIASQLIKIINYKKSKNYTATIPKIILIKTIQDFGSNEKLWQFEVEKIMNLDAEEFDNQVHVSSIQSWHHRNFRELIYLINTLYDDYAYICYIGHSGQDKQSGETHFKIDFLYGEQFIPLNDFFDEMHQIKNTKSKTLVFYSCNTVKFKDLTNFKNCIVNRDYMDFRNIFPFAFAFFRILISTDDIPEAFKQAKTFTALLSPTATDLQIGESK